MIATKKQQHKINLCYIKSLKFTKDNYIKIKRKIDGKVNLDSNCINCCFKKFETTDKEELTDLLEILIHI